MVDREVFGTDGGLDVNIPTLGIVVVSAIAANAGHHVLALIRGKPVVLMRRRVGIHLGCVIAAVVALIAIRFGISALSLGIILRLGVRAAGVPRCLLVNMIAGVDFHFSAIRLVGGVEVDARFVGDVAIVIAVAAISGAVVACRNFEGDRVGWKRCFWHGHVSLPGLVGNLRPQLGQYWFAPDVGQDAKVDATRSERVLPKGLSGRAASDWRLTLK